MDARPQAVAVLLLPLFRVALIWQVRYRSNGDAKWLGQNTANLTAVRRG